MHSLPTIAQAAQYHILSLCVGSFISDPALGWLQSKEVTFPFNRCLKGEVGENIV
jgi:hypothetical protein